MRDEEGVDRDKENALTDDENVPKDAMWASKWPSVWCRSKIDIVCMKLNSRHGFLS